MELSRPALISRVCYELKLAKNAKWHSTTGFIGNRFVGFLYLYVYFHFGSGNGEKDGINDWKKNQRNETGSRNVTGTACRSIVYEEMHDFCI